MAFSCGRVIFALFLVGTALPLLKWLLPVGEASSGGGFAQLVGTMWGSLPGAAQCPCPGNAAAVRTTIDVDNSSVPSGETERLIAQTLLGSSSVVQSSKSISVQRSGGRVRFEVMACGAPDPVESYAMASAAQRLLGGGALTWSAVLEPGCPEQSPDLTHYFDLLGSHSEHKELLGSHRSNFSHAAIWRIGNGTCLMLNDVIMSDSRDEHVYHEVLVHPAVLAAEQPRRALIIGGGEGATLREVLRDPRIEHVTMVDLDEGLVRLCQQHLQMMHQGSFDSPKVTLLFDDGVEFLRRTPSESFDVVIVDGIDLSDDLKAAASYGNPLFEQSFYASAHRVLRRGGTLVQYLSDADKDDNAELLLSVGFDDSQYLCVDVASFFGEGACFMLTGKALGEPLVARLEQRASELAPTANLRYLTPEAMRACISRRVRRLKGGGGSRANGAARAAVSGLAAAAAAWAALLAGARG